jgi:Zn-finger nucleic acid-binding protein
MVSETTGLQSEKCPKCHKKYLKDWKDLTSDEKFVVERLPMSAEFSKKERQHHLFCTNCWYESSSSSTMV